MVGVVLILEEMWPEEMGVTVVLQELQEVKVVLRVEVGAVEVLILGIILMGVMGELATLKVAIVWEELGEMVLPVVAVELLKDTFPQIPALVVAEAEAEVVDITEAVFICLLKKLF